MDQQALFYETVEDAIREDIRLAGGNKAVGAALKPTAKDPASWLRTNTNPDQDDSGINYRQLLFILDKVIADRRSSEFLNYLGQKHGFRIEWIEPEDELTKLLRAYLHDQEKQGARKERIDSLIAKTNLRAIK